ncbi:MAG: amidohydrolase family protein [Candidatus Binataceae bacterium]
MARNGFKVMDSDMHLTEPADLWQRYIDPVFKEIAPIGLSGGTRLDGVSLPGNRHFLRPPVGKWFKALKAHMEPNNAGYQFAIDRGWDGVSQLTAMDQEGIDVAILYPTRGLYVLGLDSQETIGAAGLDPVFAAAIARAYNDWLYNFCAPDRKRLVAAAMIAPHNISAAVAEARRAVTQLGFRAIFMLPGLVNKRPWHHRSYDPLWAECERLGVPVAFHGGGPDHLTDYGLELTDMMMMWHTFSHSLGPMAAAVSLTAGGVLERFPQLRLGFLEANCTWAPWLFSRLDDEYEEYIGRFEIQLQAKPSEYFRRNCFVSVEADEKPVRLYVDWFGDDNVVFSTDYPHPDSKFPHAVEKFLSLPLSETSKRKFLWDNCAKLYDL